MLYKLHESILQPCSAGEDGRRGRERLAISVGRPEGNISRILTNHPISCCNLRAVIGCLQRDMSDA